MHIFNIKVIAIIMLSGFLFACTGDEESTTIAVSADFTSNKTSIEIGQSISFIDKSTGNPTSWHWTFEGGEPSSSLEQNPTVSWTTAGVYSVSLNISNSETNDSESKDSYITVSEPPLSSAKQLITFNLSDELNDISIDSDGIISGTSVTLFLPPGSNSIGLIPNFVISENSSAFIGNEELMSGETELDLSENITVEIIAEDGSSTYYIIELITDFPALDVSISSLMSSYNIPGIQLAIVNNEKLVYMKSFGMANKEEVENITDNSLFRIASISKPITAIAIFKLAEMGALNIDDLVFGNGALLGTKYGINSYSDDVKQITVRHLLEHTSGWDNDPYDPMFYNISYTHEELISDILDNRPLATQPGSTYYYSNFGYCVLGRIIEEVTGLSYDQFVNENLLNSIGITEMKIAGNTLADRQINEVKYYDQESFSPYIMNVTRMDSHGGWIASTKDLAKFLVHIDRNSSKSDIVSSSYLQELYFSSTNWLFYGSLPGTSTAISRVNDSFGYVIFANTRTLPVDNILNDMNNIMTTEISNKSTWPKYDLF